MIEHFLPENPQSVLEPDFMGVFREKTLRVCFYSRTDGTTKLKSRGDTLLRI